MHNITLVSTMTVMTDIMIPFTLLSVWLMLSGARKTGPGSTALAIPVAFALVWASLWSWYPALAALRWLPPPSGQAAAILGLILSLLSLLFLPAVRNYFKTVDPQALVSIGPWRTFYGAILLIMGLSGGLPPAFFWSAAVGDIVVGLWAMSTMKRRPAVSEREMIAWNIFGFADLAHVLALGAINLGGFYAANPTVPFLNLLPLAGVPVLLVLHVMTLWGMIARRREATMRITPLSVS